MPLAADVDLEYFSQASEGLSGAETALICREAGLKALSFESRIENLNDMSEFKIEKQFIEEALAEVKTRGKNKALF